MSDARWCDCPGRPAHATRPLSLVDHGDDCAFPEAVCEVREHRMTRHEECGRWIEMLFCGCAPTNPGYILDETRGWWVHVRCGWPTRAWFESDQRRAPEGLRGIRPLTYHEFAIVPKAPKASYERLTARQRELNAAFVGRWVRD